jgi:hypothetical protein
MALQFNDHTVRTRREYSNEGVVEQVFGRDDRGRVVGARARLTVEVHTDETDDSKAGTWMVPAGTYFTYRPHATRNGKPFGASQNQMYFATREERDAAVEQYFAGARKRYEKKFGSDR